MKTMYEIYCGGIVGTVRYFTLADASHAAAIRTAISHRPWAVRKVLTPVA